MCFPTSRPANNVICSFIDSNGYASGPIRRCLFIDYIIISFWATEDTICHNYLNNVNFPESKFALLFLHTTENNFGKQKTGSNERMEYSQIINEFSFEK